MNKTGFGFLRLPLSDETDEKSIDYSLLNQMVDTFIRRGGTYFDTAYTYLNGESEVALRKSVVERYPRDLFRIADKLPTWMVTSYEQCDRYFDEQLKRCGVDYFDVYLMHGLDVENYEICKKYDLFRFLSKVKEGGRARAIGFSFHDSPGLLERILTEHPEVDYVQLQINYLDWDSEVIQARRCYEVAVKHKKKIIIMEPVKGGSLANVPKEAEAMLREERPLDSSALWAIRFASGLEQVEIVLSGMNTMEQMLDNMQKLDLVSQAELHLLEKVAEIIRAETAIACTGCSYCTANCLKNIPIPKYFSLYNEYARHPKEGWKMQYRYTELAKKYNKASECMGCGLCESNCPQKLEIRDFLKTVEKVFEE